jgi:hypothetical protein
VKNRKYWKCEYQYVRPCAAGDGYWEVPVVHEDLSDYIQRCIVEIIADVLRLVASGLYKTWLPSPGHFTCSRAITWVVMAHMPQSGNAEIVVPDREMIITAARIVNNLVMDVEEYETSERLSIQPIPFKWYM